MRAALGLAARVLLIASVQDVKLDGFAWRWHRGVCISGTGTGYLPCGDRQRIVAPHVPQPYGRGNRATVFAGQPSGPILVRGQIGTNPRSALVIGVAAVEVGLKGLVVTLLPGTNWLRRPVGGILRETLPTLPPRAKLVDGGPITPPPQLIKQIEDAVRHRNKVVHAGELPPAREELAVMLRAIDDCLWMCDVYMGEHWAIRHISRETLKHWQ